MNEAIIKKVVDYIDSISLEGVDGLEIAESELKLWKAIALKVLKSKETI